MAQRGEVLVVKRRLGFGSEGRPERFVVLQSNVIGGVFDTTVVSPLDDALPLYRGDPLAVPVSAKEAGASMNQVALVSHLTSARLERFEPAPVGKLKLVTMRAVEAAMRLLLELP